MNWTDDLIRIRDEYNALIEIKLMGTFFNCTIKCAKRDLVIKEQGEDWSSVLRAIERFKVAVGEDVRQNLD